MNQLVIRTKDAAWPTQLARAYKAKQAVRFADDAHIGVDPRVQSIFEMTRRAGLSPREIAAVAVAGGMTAFGAAMTIVAVFDPEPTSKLAFAGLAVFSGGGFTTIYSYQHKAPERQSIARRFV